MSCGDVPEAACIPTGDNHTYLSQHLNYVSELPEVNEATTASITKPWQGTRLFYAPLSD